MGQGIGEVPGVSTTIERDRAVLRPLVEQYLEICRKPVMAERREAWRCLNSLRPGRPMIIVRGGRCWREVPETTVRECRDPVLHAQEAQLRMAIFQDSLDDDRVCEPFLRVHAAYTCRDWGMEVNRAYAEGAEGRGAWKHEPPIKDLSDISALRAPTHRIDDDRTAEMFECVSDAVGDLIPVVVDRTTPFLVWKADISTELGYSRGIDRFMMDMYDDPEGLHRLCRFYSENVKRIHDEAEAAGDWSTLSHSHQSMTYCDELPDPTEAAESVERKQLWCYMAAQEFTLVSPEMHDEFVLQYQLPVMSEFGLVQYGCCEDLTRKIDMLRKIPNLRMIGVAPIADIRACSEQIGTDYAISYRPSPADMVCCGFDPDRVRRIAGDALDVFRGQHIEINLKDVDTVENEPARLGKWVSLVRDEIEKRAGT